METPNFKNIKYGQLVELASLTGQKRNHRDFSQGYHAGVKVHFFNKRGVLVGNVYEFVPYEYIRFRPKKYQWERVYMDEPFERLKSWVFEAKCRLITILIRNTQIIFAKPI